VCQSPAFFRLKELTIFRHNAFSCLYASHQNTFPIYQVRLLQFAISIVNCHNFITAVAGVGAERRERTKNWTGFEQSHVSVFACLP
jgi:hypothetical protein